MKKSFFYLLATNYLLLTVFFLLLTVLFPLSVFAQDITFTSLVNNVADLINIIIPFLIGVGVFAALAGMLKYIAAGGDLEKLKEGKTYIIYGVLAVFVMVSFWGLVALVHKSLLGT